MSEHYEKWMITNKYGRNNCIRKSSLGSQGKLRKHRWLLNKMGESLTARHFCSHKVPPPKSFKIEKNMSFACMSIFTFSFPVFMPFLSFSSLKRSLEQEWWNRNPCLIPDLKRKTSTFPCSVYGLLVWHM